jgi:Tol biopolymer transport system component
MAAAYVIPRRGVAHRLNFGYEPRWSPDGSSFCSAKCDSDLPTFYVVGLDGMPPRPVRPDVLGRFSSLHAAWHPDGGRIPSGGRTARGEVLNVPLDAGGHRPDVAAGPAGTCERLMRFAFGPVSSGISFEGRAGDTQNVWRITLDLSTENWVDGPERLTTGAGQETNVAISPDGTKLAFTATSSRTRLWAFPLDPASGRITGQPYSISHGSTGEVDFDASADGTEVAYRTVRAGRNELWERSTVNGHERLVLSSTSWRFSTPRWSPDRAKLALRCAMRTTRCGRRAHGWQR